MSSSKLTKKKFPQPARPDTTTAKPQHPPTEIYAENAVWRCENLLTGLVSNINGALAQVLKQYPQDYRLTFLSPTEGG